VTGSAKFRIQDSGFRIHGNRFLVFHRVLRVLGGERFWFFVGVHRRSSAFMGG